MANDDQHPSNSRPGSGPTADDPVYKELEVQRNTLRDQAEYQATPETDYPHLAAAKETDTAVRADAAAGLPPDPDTLSDAERAYQQSRGDRRPREDANRPG